MGTPFSVIGSGKRGCDTCQDSGGHTGSPTRSEGTSVGIIRGELARAAWMGAAAVRLLRPLKPQDAGSEAKERAEVPNVSADLAVIQQSKGLVVTQIDEFFKVGPSPSSSHTMGPMRITYDFYQRTSELPEDQLKRASALKVHLYGSLSATGKGHGTDRAALGKYPEASEAGLAALVLC